MHGFRILHIADVHFDTPFACKSDRVREALREGTRTAFGRAVDDAIASDVDAVLIAGDLLDDERLRLDTERFLIQQLERLCAAGIPVVYATGNHDPAVPSARVIALEWPQNVTVVGTAQPQELLLERAAGYLRVVAAGHATARETTNLAATFPVYNDEITTVGLLHANLDHASMPDEHRPYAPCSIEDLRRTGYSYWALGHVHAPQSIGDLQAAWYSGCLQGRHFRESGERGGCLVSIAPQGEAVVEFRPYGAVRWEEVTVDELADRGGVVDIDRLVAGQLHQIRMSGSRDTLAVRVILRGPTDRWEELADPDQVEVLAARWEDDFDLLHVEIDSSNTYRPLDMNALRAEPTVLAEALELLDSISSNLRSSSDLPSGRSLLERVLPPSERAAPEGDIAAMMTDSRTALLHELAERLYEVTE